MSGVSAVIRGFEKIDYALLHNLLTTKLLTAVIMYGGLTLCVAGFVKMIQAAWHIWDGVPYGAYFRTFTAVFGGPSSAWMFTGFFGASGDLQTAICFGWCYAPTLLALWCFEDQDNTERPASAFYLLIYGCAHIGVSIYILMRAVDAGGDGIIGLIVILAAGIALGLYLQKKDALDMAKVVAIVRQRQAEALNKVTPSTTQERPPGARQSSGSTARPYAAAPSSLANDFDVPPQR